MSGDEEVYAELLGAYALDAVDDDERRAIEQYVQMNPHAAAEVGEHQEVAAMLAWTTMSPPAGLWDRIAASLDEPAPAPSGDLAKVMPIGPARRRRLTIGAGVWIGVAAAAAAVIGVVAVSAVTDDSAPPLAAAYEDARSNSESRRAQLVSTSGVGVDAVVDPNGHGFVDGSRLPGLPSDRTYQLWGVIDGEAISLGLLGREPHLSTFSVAGNLTQLVITIEAAGGVPTNGNPDGAFVGDMS